MASAEEMSSSLDEETDLLFVYFDFRRVSADELKSFLLVAILILFAFAFADFSCLSLSLLYFTLPSSLAFPGS